MLHGRLVIRPFGLRHGGQHPVGQIIVRVRLGADADLDPRELVGAETGDKGLQAVVPACGAVFPDTELADGKRNVIKQDEDPLRRSYTSAA